MNTEQPQGDRSSPASEHKYDLVVSFAGEDRAYVKQFVDRCKEHGYAVFYDEDETDALWGEELTEFFADVYERQSRFAVMFISEHYARKAWTIHERRSILQRALEQAPSGTGPYLLPVRIDDTKLPGVRNSIGYMDSRSRPLDEIVGAVRKKLGDQVVSTPYVFPGRTPRTKEDLHYMLAERPTYWELYYSAYLFEQGVRSQASRISDVKNRLFEPGDFVPVDQVRDLVRRELAAIRSISVSFERLLTGPAQVEAWGTPEQPGDSHAIEYLAERYVKILALLLAWAERVGSYTSDSDHALRLFEALAAKADQPIEAVSAFPYTFREKIDQIEETVARDWGFNLNIPITWDVPSEVSSAYEQALEAFSDEH